MAETIIAPQVFTAITLAKRWGCSKNTIYKMINEGKIKAFKVGGSLQRIRLDEVERWERESAGDNMQSVNTGLAGIASARSLSGTMRAETASKSNSDKQTKALQELHSINSQLKPN